MEAKDFLSKAANENKAIEFRIDSSSQKDSPFEICCWLLGWAGWDVGLKINWNQWIFFTRRKLIKLLYDFHGCQTQVVLEESTSAGGVSDGKPMSIYALMVQLERQGVLDLKLSCHNVQRPPSVVRGEDEDRSDAIKHITCFSFWENNSWFIVWFHLTT